MSDETFLEELQLEAQSHRTLRHPFLRRFAKGNLDIGQLRTFAVQHYLYSRMFARNLAALISNTPDEQARMLLVLNMYEEIGEPSRVRDRVHLLLLEHGLVSGSELGLAMEELVESKDDDVVALLIKKGVVSRGQVASVMELNTKRAKDLTHPALFRRFLRGLGLTDDLLAQMEPIPATVRFADTYSEVCRHSHWLSGMGAMGQGTECIVPAVYGQILSGLQQSGLVSEADRVFWTIHVHCDDGHGRNIVEAMRPYVGDAGNRKLVRDGALRVLEARSEWLTGLHRHVFREEPESVPPPRRKASKTEAGISMSDRAHEFSKQGDKVFSALSARFPEARKWRLLIDHKLPSARFAAIHSAMLSYVSAVLDSPIPLSEADALRMLLQERGNIPNYTSGGMLAPKREHTLAFNALHTAVADAFSDFGIEPHVDGIDLPINVRMVYGQVDPKRANAPFSSSKRHADVWAGVPGDAVVVVLPVLGDIDNITIECAEMPREQELAAMHAMDDYDQGADVPVARHYSEGAMQHGHVYLADARLLHQTVRRVSEGVRLSVDFRFRSNDPSYRAMLPPLVSNGPDSADTRIPYERWLNLGRDELIVFEETMEQTRKSKAEVSSSPVNLAKYQIVRRNAWED